MGFVVGLGTTIMQTTSALLIATTTTPAIATITLGCALSAHSIPNLIFQGKSELMEMFTPASCVALGNRTEKSSRLISSFVRTSGGRHLLGHIV